MKRWFAAYAMSYTRYTDYRGRSRRGEMWNFVINTIIFELIIWLVTSDTVILAVCHIVAMVAMAALSVRRFHDIGWSGWFLLALFVPVINFCALAVLLFFRTQQGENRYGPEPGAGTGPGNQ